MKKTVLLSGITAICLGALVYLTSFKPAEAGAVKSYILVEVYEVPTYAGIYVHKGNNKTEFVPFKEFKAENHAGNGEITLSVLNKLADEGYEIQHTASGLAQSGMITKIFLQKTQ